MRAVAWLRRACAADKKARRLVVERANSGSGIMKLWVNPFR
jgi:hypothetical protein